MPLLAATSTSMTLHHSICLVRMDSLQLEHHPYCCTLCGRLDMKRREKGGKSIEIETPQLSSLATASSRAAPQLASRFFTTTSNRQTTCSDMPTPSLPSRLSRTRTTMSPSFALTPQNSIPSN